jgi:hypothetical protein
MGLIITDSLHIGQSRSQKKRKKRFSIITKDSFSSGVQTGTDVQKVFNYQIFVDPIDPRKRNRGTELGRKRIIST